MSRRLLPWSLVHLLAVPIALIQVARCLKKSEQTDQQPAAGLFSALYLGWLLQAMLLQHLHDYAQLPAILLGVGVVVGLGLRSWPVPVLTTAVLGVALLSSPVLKAPYREAWSASWKPADKAKLQNQLVEVAVPDWEDLERTAEFLESLNVEDGEVHCFHHLYFYDRLEIAPPIRFTYFPFRFECNPSKRAGMLDALRKSRHKLVISDLATQNLSADAFTYDAESKTWKPGDHFPESLKRQYPWSLPVVFQSGTILVHQMGTNR